MAVLALPIDLALEALAGLLLICAAVALGFLTRDVFAKLPWPLYLVAAATYNAIVGSIAAMVTWTTQSAQNTANTFRAIVINPYIVLMHTTWGLGDTATALHGFRTITIPFWAAIAEQYAFGLVMQARFDLGNAVAHVLAQAAAWFTAAIQRADQVGAIAVTHADQVGAAAVAHADQVGLLAFLRTDLALAQAVTHADQVGARDVAFTQAAMAEAIDVARQVGVTAEGFALELEREALAHTDAMGLAVSAYAAQLAALVDARAAARSATISTAVTAIEDSPCMQTCGALGDLGALLQGLTDAGLLAVLLALLAEAERDPGAVAAEIEAVLGGPARDAVSALSLGIPA